MVSGAGEMGQLVKGFLHKHGDLSLIPGVHIEQLEQLNEPAILALGKWEWGILELDGQPI